MAADAVIMRLDQILVERRLVASRARARDLILRGFVTVDGVMCAKPGREFMAGAFVAVRQDAPSELVSRGGEKLIAALDHFGFSVDGNVALDIGASTGGFTQVLLQRGARCVYAVDVGTAQLHPALKADARVRSLEQCDARQLSPALIAEPVDIVVADVSFISLKKALPAALTLVRPGASLVALIKPQFEAGPQNVGKGGIVRDAAVRRAVVDGIEEFLTGNRWRVRGVIESPILGGSGNEEFLIGASVDV